MSNYSCVGFTWPGPGGVICQCFLSSPSSLLLPSSLTFLQLSVAFPSFFLRFVFFCRAVAKLFLFVGH